METMANRIEKALNDKNGGNQSEMARFVGVSPQAVQKWVAGASEPRGKNLELAAQFLDVSPAFLLFGGDQTQKQHKSLQVLNFPAKPGEVRQPVTAHHPEDPLPEELVAIKQSKVFFSAGDGYQPTYEIIEESEPATYQLSWFQKQRINPEKCRRFKVVGDSQEPFLFEGDTVLVNLAETDIIDGKLYAIRYGNDLRIKFLSRRLDGTLIIKSRNEAYKDEEVPPGLAQEQITVIGRVRDKSGSGGL